MTFVRPRSILCVVAVFAALAGSAIAQKNVDKGFLQFLDRLDSAQRDLQNGDPTAYKSLWDQSDDVTLSGGFGGKIEKGWADVSARLDWASKQFSKGKSRIERLTSISHGDLGYVVQLEHIEYTDPRSGAPATKDYRVTMVFRKSHGQWKVVHRQADSNLNKETQR